MDAITCTVCGKPMVEGWLAPDADLHYCSPECLHEHYTPDQYEAAYEVGDCFWTTWHDDTEGSVTA